MTDGTIVALSLTGGFSVLVGYYFISVTGVGSKLYKVFREREKRIFLVLSMLSIISFFYLFYWASFTDSLEGWKRDLYIGSVATYLVGASLWSIMVYKIVKQKQPTSTEFPALLITALGTIGVLVSIAYTDKDRNNAEYVIAVIASSIFLFQHAIFDLFYWSTIHIDRRKEAYQ